MGRIGTDTTTKRVHIVGDRVAQPLRLVDYRFQTHIYKLKHYTTVGPDGLSHRFKE